MQNGIPIAEELPAEARELVEKVGKEIAKIQEQKDKQVARVQAKFDQDVAELDGDARQKIESKVEKLVATLKPMQVAYAKEGQLDEALAIRDQIKQLANVGSEVQPDPGALYDLADQVGKTFSFDITGTTGGTVWGTDVYTSDSALATSAVHAGKVRVGERKVVQVTIVKALSAYQGSTRNGVTTASYGPYPRAYRFA